MSKKIRVRVDIDSGDGYRELISTSHAAVTGIVLNAIGDEAGVLTEQPVPISEDAA